MRLGRFGAKPEATAALVDLCRELHALPPAQRREAYLTLSPDLRRSIKALDFEWLLFARPEQLAPALPWKWWVMCGGRAGGKTRTAVEQVIEWAHETPGTRIALIGKDAGSVRKIQITGKSGILRRSPPWFAPVWHKTDKVLEWPNGSIAEHHSSEEPGTLRGPEYDKGWITELFHWAIPKNAREPIAWQEGIKLGLRLGDNAQGIIDSSPRRTDFCSDFLLGKKDAAGNRAVTPEQIEAGEWRIEHVLTDHDGKDHRYVVVARRWSSERNAENLAPGFVAEMRHDFKGSALEEQELDGKILVKVQGALFNLEQIEADRVDSVPRLVKIYVAVDPTRANTPRDEAGIVAGGLGEDGHVYVMDDESLHGSPDKWGQKAINLHHLRRAEAIVREKNRLDQSLKDLIRTIDPKVKWIDVQATENKKTRAEPVSAAYEQHKVHHVREAGRPDKFLFLEEEMVTWDPRVSSVSPNRMDALVWLVTALLGLGGAEIKPPLSFR